MRSPEVLTRPRASAQGSQTFGIPPFAIVGRDDHLDWLSTSSPKPRHTLRAAEFLSELVTREVVSVEHISGVVMLADILTKAASRGVFVDLIKQLDSFA